MLNSTEFWNQPEELAISEFALSVVSSVASRKYSQCLYYLGFITLALIGCKVYAFITSTAALAEIWTLTLVSVDRCQAIFHPLETKKRMTSVQVRILMIFNANSASAKFH